jgi:hypothetical protein
MKRVTLRFPSLQLLADCMFQLSITKPVIDYENFILTADLSDRQIADAVECEAEILEQVVLE